MQNNQPSLQKLPFHATQHQFASYIRNPNPQAVPANVKPERMAVYRELFFNNVESFLSSGFPVLRRILTNAQWSELTQDFFSRHQSKTPYFSEISEEFLDFLQNERNNSVDYPFLLELAHYEWVEMALSIAQEHAPPFTEYIDDFLQQKLKLSPVAWPLAYQYPVHQISPDFLPTEPPSLPTYLIVYRGWDDEVGFIQISAIIFRLLQIIEDNPQFTLAACLTQVSDEAKLPNSETVIANGLEIVQKLFNKSILA
jgi:hypothetical protein